MASTEGLALLPGATHGTQPRIGPRARPRLRVEAAMGTMISIQVIEAGTPAAETTAALDALFATIADIERRFSPWLADSEVSRIADERLSEAEASDDLRWVLAVCGHLADVTGGAFDARRNRPDGRLDPSGFVKGWAVDEAARRLDDAGIRSYSINAGGDVLARGERAPGLPWRVGIRHPDATDAVAAVLEVRDLAVATSGLYERGGHIRDPRTGDVPAALRSLTVVGPSLGFADAYATAGFVMGLDGPAWVASRPGYDALAISVDDRLVWTPGIDRLLSRSSHPAPLK
jgi:FAD:protein FMN transferase